MAEAGAGGGGAGFDPFKMFEQMFGGGFDFANQNFGGAGGARGPRGGGGFGGGGGAGGGGGGGPGFFTGDRHVTEINRANAKSLLGKSARGSRVWAVLFYSPGCGHCQAVKGTWAAFGKKMAGVVGVAAVDCTNPSNRELCGIYKIQGFPTIKVLHSKGASEHQGPRTVKAFADSALRHLVSKVKVVRGAAGLGEEKAPKFVDKCFELGKRVCVIFVSSKSTPTSLAKALSSEFEKTAAFAQLVVPDGWPKAPVDGAEVVEPTLAARLGKAPAVVAFRDSAADKPLLYKGEISHAGLSRFVSKLAATSTGSASSSASGRDEL